MSHRTFSSCALALFLLAGACGDDGGSAPVIDAAADSLDRKELLANIGENIVLPMYERFDTEVAAMGDAIDAYCEGLGTGDQGTLRAAAQDAWRQAIDTWQHAEMMLFGPVAMDERALREVIYSWNIVSGCAVDQDVNLLRIDAASYDISSRFTNRRGLDALEYVLFRDELDHTCPSQIAPEGWDELADADRVAARCTFAQAAVADLAAQAQTLVDAWRPEGGNYLEAFASASAFASAQAGVNVVSDAMFYLDTETKDMKLAEPAGIAMNFCGTVGEPCLEELESQYAHRSKEHVIANLKGFQMLFLGQHLDGSDGVGFDELLRDVGAESLAGDMTANIEAAIAALEAVPGTMRDALQDDYEAVASAHAAVKAVTDDLKSQFLTVLGLDLPDSGAADND